MCLTKKHFIKVAEILNKYREGRDFDARITDDFVEWFESENSDFNEQKFRQAVLKKNN